MRTPSSLKKKIFIGMVLTGLIPILILSFQNYYLGKQAIEKLEIGHLEYALKSRMLWLREWLRHSKKEFNRIAPKISLEEGEFTSANQATAYCAIETLFKGHSSYRSLTIYNKNWMQIIQYPLNYNIPQSLTEKFKKKFTNNTLLVPGQPYLDQKDETTILPLGQSLGDRNGIITGFIVAELDIKKSLERILGDTSDLDESGVLSLVASDGTLLFTSACSTQNVSSPGDLMVSSQLVDGSNWELRKRLNNKGAPVFYIAASIPEINWILMLEIEKMQVLKEFQKHILFGWAIALFVFLIILFIAHRSARSISNPLDEFAHVARHIAKGNFQERLPEFKEEDINEVGRSFNAMLDTLEQNQKDIIQTISLGAVGKLSSSIVHEMRNPLSSVKINLQALARKVKDDPAYSEMATIALMQVKRLESMFTDLLNFSKPIELKPESVTFRQLVDEVLEILTRKAAGKSVSIEVVDNLENTLLKVDKQHVILALLNLVDNAIQWSPAESVICVTSGMSDQGGFYITVRDSGPGLREDQMAKLFQPFYTAREKGTGLGLANVKKIVEFHGGTVAASNSPDGGAQFTMTFIGRLLQ